MKKIAILVCLTLLVSLFAVNVGAYGETVTNTVDFRTLTPADAGDASKAAMEALGITIPEDSNAWWLQDCFHVFATPQDGYKICSYIQTLEAGEGKIFASDVTLSAGYWLAAVGDPSWFWVEVSTDGQTWTEAFADEAGRGAEWDASAYGEGALPLAGTAGASKIYVKFNVERHSGQTSGGISFSTLSAPVKGVNEVASSVDFKNLTPANAGADSKAAMESLGIIVPDDSNAWWIQDCFHVFATPQEGYQTCSYIQTLEAGEGKVFAGDVNLTAGYWLAAVGDPSWFWVEVSTDGETWNEVFSDEAGRGAEWDASAYGEGTISLPGTAGASKIFVKFNVERHSGQTSGGITFSTLFADVKDAETVEPTDPQPSEPETQPTEPSVPETEPTKPEDPNSPGTGDAFGIVVAMMAASGLALIALKKKEN